MFIKHLNAVLWMLISAVALLLASPTAAQVNLPKPGTQTPPAPVPTSSKVDWIIISAKRFPPSSKKVKIGEQLKYRVTLEKAKRGSHPVRITVYPRKPEGNWRTWIDGTKFNISAERQGDRVTHDILVRYSDRYAFGPDYYGFDLVLETPDGKRLEGINRGQARKKVRLWREVEPKPKPKPKPKDKSKQAKKTSKAKSSGVIRRSGVAGNTADLAIQFKAPKKKLLLRSIQKKGGGPAHCVIQANFHQLGEVRSAETMESATWCDLDKQTIVGSYPSEVKREKAEYGIFGIRACTDDRNGEYGNSADKVEFWYKKISGRKLDKNKLRRQTQWAHNRSCTWRPWQYCPKDKTQQRMIAVGYEAHIKNYPGNNYEGSLHGIRLICRPLADVWID